MSGSKHIDRICVIVILFSLLLTVLFMNGGRFGLQVMADEDAERYSDSAYFTTNDRNADWDTGSACVITLDGSGGKISGSGAYFYDGDLVISASGYYVITGSLDDGSIIVDAYDNSKIWILLDGVDVNSPDSAALIVEQADKVFLTLAEGSANTFTGAETFSEEALEDGVSGAVFARDDLTVNAAGDGSGKLTVSAPAGHGIAANDDLVITGGTITVTAAEDAVHAHDSVKIMGASLDLTAGDDGVKVTNEAEGQGYFYMLSGSLAIVCAGDGIHAAGEITIDGGSFTIAAGDDGIHSDTSFVMTDGKISISECCEGIEAITIEIGGGDTLICSSDDGLNANGGSSGFGGGFGGDTGAQGNMNRDAGNAAASTDAGLATGTSTETWIRVTGGTLTVISETGRDADGLDSNGDIFIEGGTVLVSLVGSGGNCAIDCGSESGGVAEISGGTVIACGSSTMAESFDSTSTQASVFCSLSDMAEDGSTLTLTGADGSVLLEWEVPCSFNSVNLSSPEMRVGETYTLTIGGESQEITLEDTVTTSGTASGMGGGMGGFGGTGGFGGEGRPGSAGGFGGRRQWSQTGDQSADGSIWPAEQSGEAGQQAPSTGIPAGMSGDPSEMREIMEMVRSGETSELIERIENGDYPHITEMIENGQLPSLEELQEALESGDIGSLFRMPDGAARESGMAGQGPAGEEVSEPEADEGAQEAGQTVDPMTVIILIAASAAALLAGIFAVRRLEDPAGVR